MNINYSFTERFEKVNKVFCIVPVLLSCIIAGCGDDGAESVTPSADGDLYKNFYAVIWRGEALDNLIYARQMGYRYVAHHGKMHEMDEATGMRFYVVNPELLVTPVPMQMDLNNPTGSGAQAVYEDNFTWMNNDPFPANLATGWWFDANTYLLVYDFQQQSVIDETVESIVNLLPTYENTAIDYRFAGLIWDVPDLKGDFWSGPSSSAGEFVDLTLLAGSNSCASLTHTHDYATYSDGKAAFYKTLYRRVRQAYPNAKFISEPFLIYDRWLADVEVRSDAQELIPDMLIQEASGTAFVDNARIFASGLISKDRVGISTPFNFGEAENRLHAAKAAQNGAWFNWFGRFGGSGDMPDYQNIDDVPPRLQLIRVLPNWDNLAGIPLTERFWDETVYDSSNSHADANIIYTRHPVTKKLFVVFHNTAGSITLQPNETVSAIHKTNGFFIETFDGSADLEVTGSEIRLTNSAEIGNGYIISTSQSSGQTSLFKIEK